MILGPSLVARCERIAGALHKHWSEHRRQLQTLLHARLYFIAFVEI